MKLFYQNSLKCVYGLITVVLIVLIVAGFFIGCGKLSDDTNRPTSPIGTSGGQTFPIKPTDSVGTYTLSISAEATTLPADGINFTTLHAYLEDSSGRSLENFTITFQADDIGRFSSPGNELATTTSGFTDAEGHVSVRFLGVQSGSCVIQASVDLNGDGLNDLEVTLTVVLTPAPACPSSAGTYTLSIRAYPNSIPADMATYSTIIAMLRDSSGGSVEDFTITFTADLGYLENDPEGPSSLSTTVTGITNGIGDSSVYLYAERAGSALVQAQVTIPDLNSTVLCSVVDVYVTQGPGEPGTGVPGVSITVNTTGQTFDAGTCGETTPVTAAYILTARVWDETGDRVGAGHRVELTGTGVDEQNLISDGMTDSTGTVTWTYNYTRDVGTYFFEVTAHTIINGVEYTDIVEYALGVTCDVPEPTPTPEPAGIELTLSAEPSEVPAGGTSTVTAKVTSESVGLSGATVIFSTNLGTVTTSATTDALGVATATFSAGATPGTATIFATATATEGSASAEATVTIISAPATVTVNASDLTLIRDPDPEVADPTGTLNIVAIVEDIVGTRIPGVTVGFTIISTAGSCAGVVLESFSGEATTNISGVAQFSTTVTGTALSGPCTYTVEAVAGSVIMTTTGTITIL